MLFPGKLLLLLTMSIVIIIVLILLLLLLINIIITTTTNITIAIKLHILRFNSSNEIQDPKMLSKVKAINRICKKIIYRHDNKQNSLYTNKKRSFNYLQAQYVCILLHIGVMHSDIKM